MNLCLSYPSMTWQGPKALPPLSTGWGAGGLHFSAEDPHRFHTWLWLDSLPEGQVGVGRKQWLRLLLPTRFRGCQTTSEGTQELFVQPSASGFHADQNSGAHVLLMRCCQEWEEIELSAYRKVKQAWPLPVTFWVCFHWRLPYCYLITVLIILASICLSLSGPGFS